MVQVRLKPWLRRAVTRCVAIIPAAIVAGVGGNAAAGKLLVLSQVVTVTVQLQLECPEGANEGDGTPGVRYCPLLSLSL